MVIFRTEADEQKPLDIVDNPQQISVKYEPQVNYVSYLVSWPFASTCTNMFGFDHDLPILTSVNFP